MKTYIGAKTVLAKPMTKGEYFEYRGWPLLFGENGNDEGYIVDSTNGAFVNSQLYKDYVSWLSKELFERDYREAGDVDLTKVTFEEAVEAMENGFMVARKAWKDGFGFMHIPSEIPADLVPRMASLPESVKATFMARGLPIKYSSQFSLVKYDNSINCWSPSVEDILATDWEVL